MTLVVDAHNHVDIHPRARQSGPDLVARMDAAGIDRTVVSHSWKATSITRRPGTRHSPAPTG